MSDETESKSLPASDKKLHDARLKGQVPHSHDFITGFTLACLFLYLLFAAPAIADRVVALTIGTSQLVDRPFAEASGQGLKLVFEVLLLTTLPLVVIVVVGVAVSGVISTFGPVFSFDPVQPDFNRINPVQTVKHLFSLRNVAEVGKALVKLAALAAAFFLILRGAIGALFETPACGGSCLVMATVETVKPLLAVAIIAFLVIGVLDLLLQRHLFRQDMRMSHTEKKRETKDQQGDPDIRREWNRLRRRGAANIKIGMQHATVAVTHGDLVIGLRYKKGQTPVPAVVYREKGEAAAAELAAAQKRGTPVVENEASANALRFSKVGEFIEAEMFDAAAWVIVVSGTAVI